MTEKVDVLIIGGGITGLMSANKLSGLGLRVALVEKEATLASGPSTRNEGWLHRGTYHASSIRDRNTAIQVARRCIYGHKQLRHFAPEAVENDGEMPIALVRDGQRTAEIVSRWDESGVRYEPITHQRAKSVFPDAVFDRAAEIFQVNDVSINTRVLYRKLFALTKRLGCVFYLENCIKRIDGNIVHIEDINQQKTVLEANKIVYASGAGTKKLFFRHHGVDLPIRYWKSHLVIGKRLAKGGIFYLDPKEVAIMHHGEFSIIGFNEDAVQCREADYEIVDEYTSNIKLGINRLFPNWRDVNTLSVACVKVDYVDEMSAARSLSVSINEPIQDHIIVLPGKMSEAPYLTDVLTSYIHERIDNPKIALRPCDQFEQNSIFS